MKLYSVDIKLCATAYIKAESEQEALRVARETYGGEPGAFIEVGHSNDVPEQLDYDIANHTDMPEVGLSRAMTSYGPWHDSATRVVPPAEMVELAYDYDA